MFGNKYRRKSRTGVFRPCNSRINRRGGIIGTDDVLIGSIVAGGQFVITVGSRTGRIEQGGTGCIGGRVWMIHLAGYFSKRCHGIIIRKCPDFWIVRRIGEVPSLCIIKRAHKETSEFRISFLPGHRPHTSVCRWLGKNRAPPCIYRKAGCDRGGMLRVISKINFSNHILRKCRILSPDPRIQRSMEITIHCRTLSYIANNIPCIIGRFVHIGNRKITISIRGIRVHGT